MSSGSTASRSSSPTTRARSSTDPRGYGRVDGIVINPAAYTHTSIAILDALKAAGILAVEVHISAVEEREVFRQISYAGMACFARVSGEGLAGYAHALGNPGRAIEDTGLTNYGDLTPSFASVT